MNTITTLTRRLDSHSVRQFGAVCLLGLLAGGCASNYEPKPDLTSVETIGVVLPDGSSQTLEAADVIELYNVTKRQDTVRNSAVGAGAGTVAGGALGAAVACMEGPCIAAGPGLPVVLLVFVGLGMFVGGAAGGFAGATVDTQEFVEVAPVHLYEVNKVLPALQLDYLTRPDLEERTLRLVRQENPTIKFVPAVPDGDRYSLGKAAQPGGPYTDVNLVLSELRVLFAGKAENNPRVTLTVHTQWTLTKYDALASLNSTWDVHAGSYESKKYPLSEWLADEGALLRSHVDEGLEESLTNAFSSLAGETEEEKWAHSSMDDSF